MSTSSLRAVFSSWQLLLLGSTAVVLSVASGWTTWDGMRNFTDEPLLSLMITFGIQGVMLITAWLIGESFAAETGQQRDSRKSASERFKATTGTSIGIAVFLGLGLVLIVMAQSGIWFEADTGIGSAEFWSARANEFKLVAIFALVVALILVAAGKDIIDNYLRSLRVIVRNAVLWVMFLACMATSVFFSFDSLFSTIFSDEERRRAADLRARSEVAGIVNDVVELASLRQLEQRTAFLKSSEWLDYAGVLDQLANELQAAPEAIDQDLAKREASEQEAVARYEAKLSSIESEVQQLSRRKEQLSKLVEQLQAQAARLETTVDTLNQQIFEKDREVIAKTAEAEAEASGIGVTSTAGRGPKYRELAEQLQRLEEEKENLELQFNAYNERLDTARQAFAGHESEIAVIESKLQQLQRQASVADEAGGPDQQTKWASSLRASTQAALQRLTSERVSFEQNPTRSGLDALQSNCSDILDLMSGSPLLVSKVETRSCDPGKTHEAAARLYALNSGTTALSTQCSSESLVDNASIEPQIALARSCLQYSRLVPADAAGISRDIGALERKRDDLAHRFVVTLNAYSDGNILAYLALAIAIAIDALVFMSGLFGASAARSLGSAISADDRQIHRQVEAMVQGALLPNVFDNATSALEALKPVAKTADTSPNPDWTHEINLNDSETASQGSLRKTLNAGVAARVVRCDATRPDKYLLKPEFIGLLCDAAREAYESSQGNAKFSDLALHAGTVLQYMQPSSESDGYSFQLVMSDVEAEDVETVRNCLNAVAPLNCVHSAGPESESVRYLIHKDLYRVLTLMSDGLPPVSVEAKKDKNVLLADQSAKGAEHTPAVPSGRQDQFGESDTPTSGERPVKPKRRSASPSTKTTPAGVRAPVSKKTGGKRDIQKHN